MDKFLTANIVIELNEKEEGKKLSITMQKFANFKTGSIPELKFAYI